MVSKQEYKCLTPSQLLRLARGFSFIFWGIPLGVLLFFNAPDLNVPGGIRIPAYLAGMVMIGAGLSSLAASAMATSNWKSHMARALLVTILLCYFAPFVHWWRNMPREPYYMMNMFIFLFAAMWLLLLINQLVADFAHFLTDPRLGLEAEFFGWSVFFLSALPFLVFFAKACFLALQNQSDLWYEMIRLHRALPRSLLLVGLLPVAFTMLCAWRAKIRAIQLIRDGSMLTDYHI